MATTTRGRLTGRTRLRITWLGKVVLSVEVERHYVCPYTCSESPTPHRIWRDAREPDLYELGLREVSISRDAESGD